MFVALLLLLSGALLFLGPAAGPNRQWPKILGTIVGLADIMQAVVLMI